MFAFLIRGVNISRGRFHWDSSYSWRKCIRVIRCITIVQFYLGQTSPQAICYLSDINEAISVSVIFINCNKTNASILSSAVILIESIDKKYINTGRLTTICRTHFFLVFNWRIIMVSCNYGSKRQDNKWTDMNYIAETINQEWIKMPMHLYFTWSKSINVGLLFSRFQTQLLELIIPLVIVKYKKKTWNSLRITPVNLDSLISLCWVESFNTGQ